MMDIKKTISSITVHGSRDSEGRDFRTQLNIALDEVCSQAGFDVQKDPDGTNVTATLPWGTVLSINDIITTPASNTLQGQVILVWSEQLKVAYIAFLNSLVNGATPNNYLQSFGLLWVVDDKKTGNTGRREFSPDYTIQHGHEGHRRNGRAEYPGPIVFLLCRHRDIKGACSAVYFSMSLGSTPAGTIVTDGVTDFYSCGNCIYIREEEK